MAFALNSKLLAVNFLCIFPFLISLSEARIASFIHDDDSEVRSENRTSFCSDTSLSFLPPSYRYQRRFRCTHAWGSISLKYFQDDDNVTTIVLSREKFFGWIGIGFSKDGGMVGSSAVVGWTGGVEVDIDYEKGKGKGKGKGKDKDKFQPGIAKFFLGGKITESVTSFEGEFNFTDAPPFVIFNNNSFYMGFQAKFGARLGQQYLILAMGTDQPAPPRYEEPIDPHVRLTRHADQAVMQVDFSSGYPSGDNKTRHSKKVHHGAMGLIAWGVLLPCGAIIPRYFKHHDPQWFYLHIAIQIIGFLLGLATIVLGIELYDDLALALASASNRQSSFSIHKGIGSLVFFLSVLQVLALIRRPDKASTRRKYWNWYHHWVGRIALLLGGLNIVIGICVAEAESAWKIGYGFLVTFILLTVAVLEASLGLGRSKKADATPVFRSN